MKKQMRCLLVAGLLLLAGLEGYGQACQRVYADDETHDGIILLSSVDNGADAVDGDVTTHSTLNILLLGTVWQQLEFTGADQPSATDAVHIKLGTQSALLGLLAGAEIQAYNNGNPVGTSELLTALISLLNGADQQEIVFSPGVAFDAVRITNTAVSLAGGFDIYEAYFYKQVAGPIACDIPVDVLYGSTGSIAGGLNAVDNPIGAIDGDPTTSARIRANVSVANKTHLTALYPVTSPAGDSIRFIIENPAGGLLDANVLATNFTIRTYNNHTDNGPLAFDPDLIRLNLFPGSTGKQVLTYAVDADFNRVELSLGEGLLTALDDLIVYEIGRLAVGPNIRGLTGDSLNVCLGDPVNLAVENPTADVVYNWYTQPIGGAAVATGDTYDPGALAVDEYLYYVSATKAECTTESGRTMVVVNVNPPPHAPTITLTALE